MPAILDAAPLIQGACRGIVYQKLRDSKWMFSGTGGFDRIGTIGIPAARHRSRAAGDCSSPGAERSVAASSGEGSGDRPPETLRIPAASSKPQEGTSEPGLYHSPTRLCQATAKCHRRIFRPAKADGPGCSLLRQRPFFDSRVLERIQGQPGIGGEKFAFSRGNCARGKDLHSDASDSDRWAEAGADRPPGQQRCFRRKEVRSPLLSSRPVAGIGRAD
jgi:hypothetical protein